MVVLGIVILLVVAVVSLAVIVNGGDPAVVDFGVFDVKTTTTGAFVLGALALLLGVLGLLLVLKGIARSRRRAKDHKQLRRDSQRLHESPVEPGPRGDAPPESPGPPADGR